MADGNVSKRIEPPRMRMIVQGSPEETLANCECIVRFMTDRIVEMGRADVEINENDREAIFRIMHTVADALQYEQQRAGGAA